MPIFNWRGILFVLALAALSACGSEIGTETGNPTTAAQDAAATVTLSSLQSGIFTPSCAKAGCHAATSAAGGLSLADGDSFSNLVGVASTQATSLKRVTASSSSTSYLINKLAGTQSSVGGSGTQMPQGAAALTDAQLQSIKDWIDAGAKNN